MCYSMRTHAHVSDVLVNTCTSDNFLTILLLHCKQYEGFLQSALGCSTVQDTLKAAVTLMIGASLSEPHHMGSTVKSVFLLACVLACNIKIPVYG